MSFYKKIYNRSLKLFLSFCLLLLSIFLYIIVPSEYEFLYNVIFLIIFLCSVFIIFSDEQNYFTFEFLFTISFFFIYYCYPVFIFPINKSRFFLFNYGFNSNVINKCTGLSTIGFLSFGIGLLSKRIKISSSIKKRRISKNIFTPIVTLICILDFKSLFGALGNYSENGDPNASGGILGYLNIIFLSIIFTSIIFEFYILYSLNYKSFFVKRNPVLWFFIILHCFAIIRSGSRTIPLLIILTIIICYGYLIGGIKLRRVLILLIFGFIGLSFILILRSHGAFKFSLNILDLGMDLIINNYTLYVAYDYCNNNGFQIMPSFFSIIQIIPMLSGVFSKLLNVPIQYTSSSRFFSYLVLGNNPDFGVGTNIIGSIYLGTGIWGVIILMFLLGNFIKTISIDIKNAGLYRLALFIIFSGSCVYLGRADYFYNNSRLFFPILFIYLFNSKYIFKLNKKK